MRDVKSHFENNLFYIGTQMLVTSKNIEQLIDILQGCSLINGHSYLEFSKIELVSPSAKYAYLSQASVIQCYI